MTTKLVVLSILDGFPYGGDENRVLQIAQAIDRERFDFRVATIRPIDSEHVGQLGNLRGEFERAGVVIIDLSVPRRTRGLPMNDIRRHLYRVGSLARTVERVVKYIQLENVAVIDGHHNAGYLTGTIAGIATGVPSLLTTYNVSEAWHPRLIWNAMHRLTLAASGAVVTDSQPVADELRSWMLQRHHSRVKIIPNGPPPPAPERTEAEIRVELGLPPKGATRIVGQIAALSHGKGQHLLLEAAPKILARHPDVTFLLIGFERPIPGYAAFLRSRARELGIADHVIVNSYLGRIGDVWQVVDIQAHPTMLDSLPNSILEGMSLGKPVVASAHAGIPSLILQNTTGIVVPVNDADAIAIGVIRLLDNPEMARTYGEAALERYRGNYTQEHLVRQMENVFTEVAKSHSS